jgi:hypothetical protein
MDTGTTTEANEPIEVDDDVSHEASENKAIRAILEAINSCHSIVCSNANAFTAVHFVFIFVVC